METIKIPLSQLSFEQKLNLMEVIWDDISKDESKFQSPDWHIEILIKRENLVKENNAKFSDWGDAKERILRNISSVYNLIFLPDGTFIL